MDGAGNLYIADSGNDVVEKVTPAGTLSVVAGTGSQGAPTPGPATSSDLNDPSGVAVDGAGNLYIAYFGNEVEKVTPAGMLSVVVGTGNEGSADTRCGDPLRPERALLEWRWTPPATSTLLTT